MKHKKYTVQIVAPSSGIKDAEQRAQEFAALLRTQGFEVKPPVGLFAENMHYYANTMENRFEQMRSALLDPGVDIIWPFRGGYGASEIVMQCMDIKPSHRKILIGFSDITVLHGLFNNIYKMPSIHGPVGTSLLGSHGKHMGDIMAILNDKDIKIALKSITHVAEHCELKGYITGGNLSILTTMIGTKLHPNTKDKILLIEDVGEKGYSVRRMLNHCSQAGLFGEVGAIIFGDFTQSDEHFEFAFEDFCLHNSHLPIFKTEGIGHGDTNTPVILGCEAVIKDGWLSITTPFE